MGWLVAIKADEPALLGSLRLSSDSPLTPPLFSEKDTAPRRGLRGSVLNVKGKGCLRYYGPYKIALNRSQEPSGGNLNPSIENITIT